MKEKRRQNGVFLCCMEEVEEVLEEQEVEVRRCDSAFFCLDVRAPATKGLECKTVWRFCLL